MTAERFTNSAPPFVRGKPSRYYQRLLRNYFTFLVPPGLRVLEVGCGLGDLLAARQTGRGVGVDFSPEMVKLARERHPELEFQVADAAEFSVARKSSITSFSPTW